MSTPPARLDGAIVLEWAWSGGFPFGILKCVHNQGETSEIEIYGLAICRYENSHSVYRFSCDKNWETQQDGIYSTIDETKRRLPKQYENASIVWNERYTNN